MATKASTPAEPSKKLRGHHALLVEDNSINQQVATQMLAELGISVSVANNGLEGVQTVEQHNYSVVLMDMQMPVMDGLQATQEIRKTKSADELTIIAMTANAMEGDREKCIAAGMDDYVSKPIDPQKLFATLERWLKPIKIGEFPSPDRSSSGRRYGEGIRPRTDTDRCRTGGRHNETGGLSAGIAWL